MRSRNDAIRLRDRAPACRCLFNKLETVLAESFAAGGNGASRGGDFSVVGCLQTETSDPFRPLVPFLVENTRFELVCVAHIVYWHSSPTPPLRKEGLCEVASSWPSGVFKQNRQPSQAVCFVLVENTRFELVTSCMPCKRSSQLS